MFSLLIMLLISVVPCDTSVIEDEVYCVELNHYMSYHNGQSPLLTENFAYLIFWKIDAFQNERVIDYWCPDHIEIIKENECCFCRYPNECYPKGRKEMLLYDGDILRKIKFQHYKETYTIGESRLEIYRRETKIDIYNLDALIGLRKPHKK